MKRRAEAKRRRKNRTRTGDQRRPPAPMTTDEVAELARSLSYSTLDRADHKEGVWK